MAKKYIPIKKLIKNNVIVKMIKLGDRKNKNKAGTSRKIAIFAIT